MSFSVGDRAYLEEREGNVWSGAEVEIIEVIEDAFVNAIFGDTCYDFEIVDKSLPEFDDPDITNTEHSYRGLALASELTPKE